MVVGLGVAQLIAWGTLYYSIAVVGEPMRAEFHAAPSSVFGAFTCAMVIAGLLAPWAGRNTDRYGARTVLSLSTLVGAVAFAMLAYARSLPELIAGWTIAGLAMSFGLYDVCFAAIGQAHPGGYRTLVTSVTLIAGFASTVFWPLSYYLLERIGWRGVCNTYAIAMLLCAPVYLAVLPHAVVTRPSPRTSATTTPMITDALRTRARVLAWAFAGASLLSAVVSAHLFNILNTLELSRDRAVWIGASLGVLQVLGRVLELRFGTRLSPSQLSVVCFAGLAVAMGLLLAAALPSFGFAFVLAFALLYGLANGLVTIAKAAVPVELLGFAHVGAVLGSFGAPSQVTRALAPLGFSWLASASPYGARLSLVFVALLSLATLLYATRPSRR